MLFKSVVASLSLLGFAASNPILGDISTRDLFPRQEEFCEKSTCCGGSGSAAAFNTSHPSLQSRALDRPANGQLNAWFSEHYTGQVPGFEELIFDDGNGFPQDYPSKHWTWDQTAPFKAGMKALSGCTAIVVASEHGLYLGHVWEGPDLKEYKKGNTEAFDKFAVEGISKSLGTAGFDKNTQPNLQAKLITKTHREGTEGAGPEPFYPDAINELKNLVASYTGLAPNEVTHSTYYSSKADSENTDLSAGKMIVTFGIDARDDGSKGYELWMGSLYNNNGQLIPAEENNDPIFWKYWF